MKRLALVLAIGALVITVRDSTTCVSAAGTILPQGLPNNGQYGNSWDVVPSSFVIRLTNSGFDRLEQQLNSLLVQDSMKNTINSYLVGQGSTGGFGCAGDIDLPGSNGQCCDCVFCGGCPGSYPSCIACLCWNTCSYAWAGCGTNTSGSFNLGTTCSDGGPTGVNCNGMFACQTGGCDSSCDLSFCGYYGFALYDGNCSGCGLPAGDGRVLYYDTANVNITAQAPNRLNLSITLDNASGPACRSGGKVSIADIKVKAGLPGFWDPIVNTTTFADVDSATIAAHTDIVFTSGNTAWGPDTLVDLTNTAVDSVALNGFYLQVIPACPIDPCSIIPGLSCSFDICSWLNGVISSWIQSTVENALRDALNGELPQMLRSTLGLPLDITEALGQPFALAQACYLFGVYPSSTLADAYGVKMNMNVGMGPITTTTGLPNIPGAMTWAQMASQCPYNACADLTSTPMPPLDFTPYGNSVFNRSTVPVPGVTPNWPSGLPIANAGQPYDLGYGVSESLLNEILYNLYISGFFCREIDAGDIDTFSHFIPMLKSIADPGSRVTIRLIPSPPATPLDPIQRTGYPVQAWVGQGACGASVCDAWAELSDYRLDFYVTVGGVPARAFSLLWDLQFGGDMSYIFVPGGVQPTSTTIGTTLPGYYHLVLVLDPTVIKVDNIHPSLPTSALQGGIGQALPVLLSSKAYAEINTALNLAGFTVGFDYIGPDFDAIGADGRPHVLSFYGVMLGNIDWKWFLLAPPQGGPPAPQVFIVIPPVVAQNRGLAPAMVNSLGLSALETKEAGFTPERTTVGFTGRAPDGSANVEYSWRLDGGFWQPFTRMSRAGLSGLLEGRHVFEVTVRDAGNRGPISPARMEFVVDSVPPDIALDDPPSRVRGDTARFRVTVWDYQTPEEGIRVSYRTDSGDWIAAGSPREFALSGLSEGRHTLDIRAWDSAYNESVITHSFRAGAGWGCDGCAVAVGGSDLPDLVMNAWAWLLPLALLWFLRRKRPGSGDGQSWALHPCASGAGHHRRESNGRPRLHP